MYVACGHRACQGDCEGKEYAAIWQVRDSAFKEKKKWSLGISQSNVCIRIRDKTDICLFT